MFKLLVLLTFSLFSLLALADGGSSRGLKVVWWNTACGSHSKNGTLDKSLLQFTEAKHQVDLVILGEFCENKLAATTIEALKKVYPHHHMMGYNEVLRNIGFGFFSKEPIDFKNTEIIDWAPDHLSEMDKDHFKSYWQKFNPNTIIFKRLYTQFKIRGINIVPIHLAHPWETYLSVFYKDEPYLARAAIVNDLIRDKNNPMIAQLQNILHRVSRDFPKSSDKVMLIGDFNFPKALLTFSTVGYSILQDFNFIDGMTTSKVTYPLHNLKIDHAMVSPNVHSITSSVLKSTGSDHYPIFIDVE